MAVQELWRSVLVFIFEGKCFQSVVSRARPESALGF